MLNKHKWPDSYVCTMGIMQEQCAVTWVLADEKFAMTKKKKRKKKEVVMLTLNKRASRSTKHDNLRQADSY